MSMIRKEVKSVVVNYEDGSSETLQTPGGFHTQRQNYSKGAKQPHEGWQGHEIRWTVNETQFPRIEEPEDD